LAPTVRSYSFTLPLAYIFHAEFHAFSASAAVATISQGVTHGFAEALELVSAPVEIAANASSAVSIANVVTAVLISTGVVTAGVSVATQILTDDPPAIIAEMPEAATVVETLADMLGEEDAALLEELREAQSEQRDNELSEVISRNNINYYIGSHTLDGMTRADAFRLSKGGKRLYIVRVHGTDRYMLDVIFGNDDAPGMPLSDLNQYLADNTP
jgi:hypothetical protein